jgi:cyanophycin synthetase
VVVLRTTRTIRIAGHVVAGVLGARLSARRRAARANHADFYQQLWSDAAADVGVPALPHAGGGLEIALRGRRLRVQGTHCSVDGPDVLARAGDKVLVARALAAAGLPVPQSVVITPADLGPALRFLATVESCVVKPARDTATGRGVTTGVRTRRDLVRAVVEAAAAGARGSAAARTRQGGRRGLGMLRRLDSVPVLVERQIVGRDYRLLYLDGELLDALRRDPPTVTGDGRRTVSALLDELNTRRITAGGAGGQVLVERDLDFERTLAAQGIRPSSIPAPGETVRLKTTINENAPEYNRPARDELCPELVEQGRRAAAVIGARLAGVDVLTSDPGVPLEVAGGCVLEVNTTPGLAMHYHGHPGEAAPARQLLSRLRADAERART